MGTTTMQRDRAGTPGIGPIGSGTAAMAGRDLAGVWTSALDFLAEGVPAAYDLGGGELGGCRSTVEAVLDVAARSARVRRLDPDRAAALARLRLAVDVLPRVGVPAAPEGRVLDVLHVERAAVLASVRTLTALSDIGHALPRTGRPVPQVLADAEALLGAAVGAGDHELTAALLTVWPLLGAPWSAPARCALDRVVDAYAAYGYLPPADGPVAEAGPDVLRAGLAPTAALALLLALVLEHGAAPIPWTPTDLDVAIGVLLTPGARPVDAGLATADALRRATQAHDMALVRGLVDLALAAGIEAQSAIAAGVAVLAGAGPFATRVA